MNNKTRAAADNGTGGSGPDSVVNYDRLWTASWGDMQKYGPTSRHLRRVIARMLDAVEFDSALDVGCGEGSMLAFLKARYSCPRLAGVDVSAAAIERAKVDFPFATYFVGEAASLRQEEPFDLVTCLDVLEHVEQDVALLRDMAALSRRYVLCATIQGRMRPREREIGHVRNYRRGELQQKMREAGLRPVRTVEWGFPFFSPLFRSFVSSTGSESLSYGRYGLGRRLVCHAIYGLFLLNSWRRGDSLFVLAERPAAAPPSERAPA